MATANDLKERLEARTDKSGDCWVWNGAKNMHGYGVLRHEQKNYLAHRAAWMVERGPIPNGLCVCHRCDAPACINPDHLFLGTHADNMHDMIAKGRARHSSPSGSKSPHAKLTDEAVSEIRARAASQPALARRFGVNVTTVQRVQYGHTWRA